MTIPFRFINLQSDGYFSTFSPDMLTFPYHSPDGRVDNFFLGNVLSNQSFDDVIRTDKFKKMLESIQVGTQKCYEECEFFILCGGDGPAAKISEHGTFNATETHHCKYKFKIPIKVVLNDLMITASSVN